MHSWLLTVLFQVTIRKTFIFYLNVFNLLMGEVFHGVFDFRNLTFNNLIKNACTAVSNCMVLFSHIYID